MIIRSHARSRRLGLFATGLVGCLALWAPPAARAVDGNGEASRWTLVTRVLATGSSDEAESEPKGYKAYSAFTLEAAVRRGLTRHLALELTLRTESREIDVFEGAPEARRLGSAELLPVSVLLQYRRASGGLRPYIGLGASLTACWEKSGAIDSSDLSPSIAPAVQLGLETGSSERAFFNVDLRWNALRTDLKAEGVKVARLKLDALTMALGVGLRF